MKRTLLYLLLLALLSSCESMISEVDVPEQKPKLVIGCYLQPDDSMIVVRVTRSFPLYSSNAQFYPPAVDYATVKISSSQGTVTLPYDPGTEEYKISTSSYPVAPGVTYSLEVSAPGFETVTAQTTVPGLANAQVQITGSDSLWSSLYMEYRMRYRFEVTDLKGTPSYYRVYMTAYSGDTLVGFMMTPELTKGKEFFCDEDGDEQKFTLEFQLPSNLTHDSTFSASFYLVTADEAYYNYNKSLVTAYNQNGNPFSEPALVYGNITNGLGVFGSCQKFRILIQ